MLYRPPAPASFMFRITFFFCLLSLLFTSCNRQSRSEQPLFELLDAGDTGVNFSNTITETDALNPLVFEYIYNGGGVAVGDVNNDGLADLFFSGNMVPSKLYLNKGNLQFEDVTEKAGISTVGRWASGAAMADVNQDGLLDLYVCVTGKTTPDQRRNLLYINQGNARFREAASAYGLADDSYSTHAAFFDYDRDGDLDLYLLNHNLADTNPNLLRPRITDGSAPNTDRLYRNNGNNTFTDVSRAAGISMEGNGLGITVSDIDQDGWPDVYVANDYLASDILYINNQNGTFTDQGKAYLRHTSQSAMGTDVADFNNDGLVDIITLDMLPEDNERQKLLYGGSNYDRFQAELQNGFLPQYMRNTLQLNNGNGTFSEIGQLAGVYATDWSWSALFADFDNDGLKDLHITNGFPKDITNRDFITYRMQGLNSSVPLEELNRQLRETIDELPGAKKPNYLYRNNGNLTFADKSADWGLQENSFSNGAAYADLDNDGDLDLVTNNINGPASIYRNQARETRHHHYLRLQLQGQAPNRQGLGAKVTIRQKGRTQYLENSPYRGFLSTVEPVLHLGLGQDSVIQELTVTWPDGRQQKLQNVRADRRLTLRQQDAQQPITKPATAAPAYFADVTSQLGLQHQHRDASFIDFKVQPLLPHKYSQLGPGLAVGDVNGDGRDDFFVGGAFKQSGQLFLQQAGGTFRSHPLTPGEKLEEDLGALFFDADNDQDLDLYVVSGSSEYPVNSAYYQDRLYRNDGQGNFKLDAEALPQLTASGSCVTAADFDADGDLDLFVGGRLVSTQYPRPAASYLLRNEGGRFRDATAEVFPALKELGLVTSALWTDFNQDGQVDLLVAGEWMPLTFLQNRQGKLHNVTGQTGLPKTNGWWNSLAAGDFDHDGDVDYVAGNLGLNTRLKASPDKPVTVYAHDFDQNGSIDPIMTYFNLGKEVPVRSRDDLFDQVVAMRRRFPTYESYAKASIGEVISEEEQKQSLKLQAYYLASAYLENLGQGKFRIRQLPVPAQMAPVYGLAVQDFDQDGHPDLVLTGNSRDTEVQMGAYDAFNGLYLRGNGKGGFSSVPVSRSGFFVPGDARGLAQLFSANGKPVVLTATNNGPVQAFSPAAAAPARLLTLAPLDVRAEVVFRDGRKQKQELYYGSSYLSQSSRRLALPAGVSHVVLWDSRGQSRQIAFK